MSLPLDMNSSKIFYREPISESKIETPVKDSICRFMLRRKEVFFNNPTIEYFSVNNRNYQLLTSFLSLPLTILYLIFLPSSWMIDRAIKHEDFRNLNHLHQIGANPSIKELPRAILLEAQNKQNTKLVLYGLQKGDRDNKNHELARSWMIDLAIEQNDMDLYDYLIKNHEDVIPSHKCLVSTLKDAIFSKSVTTKLRLALEAGADINTPVKTKEETRESEEYPSGASHGDSGTWTTTHTQYGMNFYEHFSKHNKIPKNIEEEIKTYRPKYRGEYILWSSSRSENCCA